MLDPEVSEEVKDVIKDLEDVLTNNVEEVKDEDKTTNGGIPVTTESVALLKASTNYGGARYLVSLESVIAIMETEGEKAAEEAMEEPGQAPTEAEVEEHEPEPENVIERIAQANDVDPDQVAVVITAENVCFLAETALLEAKCGKKKGKAGKKARKARKVLEDLKGKVTLVKA
jgi:hypothetical protein